MAMRAASGTRGAFLTGHTHFNAHKQSRPANGVCLVRDSHASRHQAVNPSHNSVGGTGARVTACASTA
jgi:hypothetical protein